MVLTLTSCSYSITMVHSEGSTDTFLKLKQQTQQQPTLNIPVTPGAGLGLSK